MSDFNDKSTEAYDEEEAEEYINEYDLPTPNQKEKREYLPNNNIQNDNERLEDIPNIMEEKIKEQNTQKKSIIQNYQKPSLADSDAIRMIETFNSISNSTFELSNLANIVIQEVEKVIKLGDRKKEDLSEIRNEYENTKSTLKNAVLELQHYLTADDSIVNRLTELENIMQSNYQTFTKNMIAIGKTHKQSVDESLYEIKKQLDKLSQGIDTTELSNYINDELKKKIQQIDLTNIKNAIASFQRLNIEFEKAAELISGKDKDGKQQHQGLFYQLSNQLDKTEKYINSFKKRLNYTLMVGTATIGLAIGSIVTYVLTTSNYEQKLMNYSINKEILFQEKINNLYNAQKGYKEFFINKHFSDKDIDFGYFEKEKKAYIKYNPNTMIAREWKGNIYIFKK